MIEMICGVCRVDGKLKRASDGPFSLPRDQEVYLVNAGVAVFVPVWREERVAMPQEGEDGGEAGVTPPNAAPASTGQETGENETGGEQEMLTGHLDATELATWRKADLQKLAEEMGVDISRAKNNAERAAILAAVEVQAPADEGEDEEAPPELGAEPPVV